MLYVFFAQQVAAMERRLRTETFRGVEQYYEAGDSVATVTRAVRMPRRGVVPGRYRLRVEVGSGPVVGAACAAITHSERPLTGCVLERTSCSSPECFI